MTMLRQAFERGMRENIFRWSAYDLVSFFDDAGVELATFGKRYSDLGCESDAKAALHRLRRHLAQTAPDHPLAHLEIVTVTSAIRLAGLNPLINKRPRSLTDADYAGPADPQRPQWLAWLDEANALYLRNPVDDELLIEDIKTAIDQGASILVLDRFTP